MDEIDREALLDVAVAFLIGAQLVGVVRRVQARRRVLELRAAESDAG